MSRIQLLLIAALALCIGVLAGPTQAEASQAPGASGVSAQASRLRAAAPRDGAQARLQRLRLSERRLQAELAPESPAPQPGPENGRFSRTVGRVGSTISIVLGLTGVVTGVVGAALTVGGIIGLATGTLTAGAATVLIVIGALMIVAGLAFGIVAIAILVNTSSVPERERKRHFVQTNERVQAGLRRLTPEPSEVTLFRF